MGWIEYRTLSIKSTLDGMPVTRPYCPILTDFEGPGDIKLGIFKLWVACCSDPTRTQKKKKEEKKLIGTDIRCQGGNESWYVTVKKSINYFQPNSKFRIANEILQPRVSYERDKSKENYGVKQIYTALCQNTQVPTWTARRERKGRQGIKK